MTYGDATYLEQSVKTSVTQSKRGPVGRTTIDFILMDVKFEPAPDVPGKPNPVKLYVPKNADQPSLYDFEIREKEQLELDMVWKAFATHVAIEYLRQKHPWAAAFPFVTSSSYYWEGETFLLSFRAVAELRTDKTPRGRTLP